MYVYKFPMYVYEYVVLWKCRMLFYVHLMGKKYNISTGRALVIFIMFYTLRFAINSSVLPSEILTMHNARQGSSQGYELMLNLSTTTARV